MSIVGGEDDGDGGGDDAKHFTHSNYSRSFTSCHVNGSHQAQIGSEILNLM